MVDTLTPEQRTRAMRAVKGRDTSPEMVVRKLCRGLGMPGYRLNRPDIPGKPDLTYVGRKLAIFVHGCFWHRHVCVAGKKMPASNTEYWNVKFRQNRHRDAKNVELLANAGWDVLILWECELRAETAARKRLRDFFVRNGALNLQK